MELDPDFNVFTGVNNSGKTNLLEAIALWHECFNRLIRHQSVMGAKLQSLLRDDQKIEAAIYEYGSFRDRHNEMLGRNNSSIVENTVQLSSLYRNHLTQINNSHQFYKCASKDDVQTSVNLTVNHSHFDFRIEQDFLKLLNCVERSTWFDEWDFLTRL